MIREIRDQVKIKIRRVFGLAAHNPVVGGNVIATYPADEATWAVAAALNPAAQSLSVYAICAT